jgi:ribonucleoside-diphosphate reductase alpha chain
MFEKVNNKIFEDGGDFITQEVYDELYNAIYNFEVMPSMRSLMTAGPALDRDNTAGYNCAYLAVDDIKAFDEAMFILLCGTGVGFSVERQFISKLPEIPDRLFDSDTTIVIRDSKEGWAKGFRQLISLLYSGEVPKWDVSRVRPAGARLKTFGGRASGPGPLEDLFRFTINTFRGAKGRRLSSIEAHDILCKVGEVVVVGGVRRSAMISLSNLTDDRMRRAKSGEWWTSNGYRALANNSIAFTETPDTGAFLREWTSLYESKSGERGIFNRVASVKQVKKNGRRDPNHEFGTNPCSEIILRSCQFCNLSEIVVRSDDGIDALRRKVRLATILGTLQSTLTDFPYLRKIWTKNTEEERLLGVSLTGILDNDMMSTNDSNLAKVLLELKGLAVEVNKEYADYLGIPASTAITCVKPSGTVSQLVDSASGIHPRHSEYYIRSVRADNSDPVTAFLKFYEVPNEPDVTKPEKVTVFYFPHRAPEGARVREGLNSLDHLELWKTYQEYWCEHKPSITVSVREREWPLVGGWVYENFDAISGVSFLPYSDHTYRQAPYQECSEAELVKLEARMPSKLDWSLLKEFETYDQTAGSQTFACGPEGCEVVDLTT